MYARSVSDLDQAGEDVFSNPFVDFSSQVAPRTLDNSFEWSEKIWNRLDVYRQGITKIIRYFLTEVDVTGVGNEQADEWQDFLNKDLNIVNQLALIAADYLVYGNSISSIVFPFNRFFTCPRSSCSTEVRADKMDYTLRDGEFHATCPKCGFSGKFDVEDRRVNSPERIHIKRWNPHNITLWYNPVTGASRHVWEPPADLKKHLNSGSRFYIDSTPMSIIKAATQGKCVELYSNEVKHLKLDNLAGVKTRGWGLPPMLSQFSQIYYTQLLKRFNEAVALDYLIPLRVLTPAAPMDGGEQATGSALATGGFQGLPEFQDQLEDMIDEHRQDPTSWHALPFPVQYGPISGEGVQMLQPELINQAVGDLLNGMGVPVEFYKGNLRWKGDPQAIRLLEKNWEHLSSAMNSWLSWFTDLISLAHGWDEVDANLKPPSMFDNMARKQLLLQLANQGQISMQTALEPWNIDLDQERKNMQEAAQKRQQEKRELQAEMTANQAPMLGQQGGPMAGGPMPGGGMTPGQAGSPGQAGMLGGGGMAGGGGMQSISEMNATAEQIASRLVQMPYSQRKSQMMQLEDQNDTLHAVVKAKMEELRDSADREASQQMRPQLLGAR